MSRISKKYQVYVIMGILFMLLIGGGIITFQKQQRNEMAEEDKKVQVEKTNEIEENDKADETNKTEERTETYIENGIVTNPNHIHVLVNKQRKLPDGYSPDDLVVPTVRFSFDGVVEKSYLRKEAAEALQHLFSLAEQDGIILYAVSGFRSYERQVSIYNNNVQTRGQEATDAVSAQPGHSEHQTGLAIDVSSSSNQFVLTQSFGETEEGKWLAANAHQAGFIIHYLQGKEAITGYTYEPWHIRYVGDIANDIYEQDTTLEQYLNIVE